MNILEKEVIKDVFEIESINKIKQIKRDNDKVILLNNSITPIKKIDSVTEEVIYKGNSYKKLKDCKIMLKKEVLNNFKVLTPQLKRKYNYISKVGGKIYGCLYKAKYNNMALVEIIPNFSEATIVKKNKEYNRVEIVDGKLYCLSEGIS